MQSSPLSFLLQSPHLTSYIYSCLSLILLASTKLPPLAKKLQNQLHHLLQDVPGLGLLVALPPPRFMRPAKKDASASLLDFPSGEDTPGVVGSGVW